MTEESIFDDPEDFPWDEYETGPFCAHWGSPCDGICFRCKHSCAHHGWGFEKCEDCDCEAFVEPITRHMVKPGLAELKPGDKVVRRVGEGTVMMDGLVVSAITEDKIICSFWEFCRRTGAEIDEELGWGPPPKATGTYITVG